jgi:hypothetical protein
MNCSRGKTAGVGKLGTKTNAMPGERRMYSIGDDTFPPALVPAAIPKFMF